MRTGKHGFRAGFFQVSSHLGDEFQDRTGGRRISFGHETFRGNYMWYVNPSARTFFELQYTLSSMPDFDPWVAGAKIEPKIGSYLLATDLRFKRRNDWDHAATLSLLYDPGNENIFVGLEAFDGAKPEGQFFREGDLRWARFSL